MKKNKSAKSTHIYIYFFPLQIKLNYLQVHAIKNVFTAEKRGKIKPRSATQQPPQRLLLKDCLLLGLDFPLLLLCYHLLSLPLCVRPCRSQVALCEPLCQNTGDAAWNLEEKANEVPCQSQSRLLIWPLQRGPAEKENDHHTCRYQPT